MFCQKPKEPNDINKSMSLASKGSKDKLDMSISKENVDKVILTS